METSGLSQAEPAFDSLAHLDREHLAAVADAAVSDQQTTSASSPTSPSQKRKRGLPSSSPESRRAKRGAPATASSSVVSNAPDAASAAYVESAVEAAQAAAQAATANSELNVLRQATNSAGHPDASDPANASSTAAAALGTMFPTLHIPPSTTDTFAAEVAAESEHQDSVNNDRPGSESLESTNGATLHSPDDGHKSGSSRPPVGSTEWQKLRKYNHKEGS